MNFIKGGQINYRAGARNAKENQKEVLTAIFLSLRKYLTLKGFCIVINVVNIKKLI